MTVDSPFAQILTAVKSKTAVLIGDICLDRYLDIDPTIADTSLETGLPVRHVVQARSFPGGGGNVIANLCALGFGTVIPVGCIGDDGEGYELISLLSEMNVVTDHLERIPNRQTPTYIKPMVLEDGGARELNRLDLFPRTPLNTDVETILMNRIRDVFPSADVVLVSDYAEAGKTGVVTAAVREIVNTLCDTHPDVPVLVDSRRSLDQFFHAILKPNELEAACLLDVPNVKALSRETLGDMGSTIATRQNRPVFLTLGADGIMACHPDGADHIPAYPVQGEIDTVGAGDTTLAALAAGTAAGASIHDAGLLGVLAASITIQQLGMTGTASPDQILARHVEYQAVVSGS